MTNIVTKSMRQAAAALFREEESVEAWEYVFSECAGIKTCTIQIKGDKPNSPVEIGAVYLWVDGKWNSVILN